MFLQLILLAVVSNIGYQSEQPPKHGGHRIDIDEPIAAEPCLSVATYDSKCFKSVPARLCPSEPSGTLLR